MTARTKQVGVILTLVAMISFGAWPFWKAWNYRLASDALQKRVNQLAAENPSLKTALDVAMVDGVLSEGEAELIVVAGGGEKPKTGE